MPGSLIVKPNNIHLNNVPLKEKDVHLQKDKHHASEDDYVFQSIRRSLYDPKIVLDSSEFQVIENYHDLLLDQLSLGPLPNLACFYNDKKQLHMVKKPMPKVHPGQVLLHIRATGICGSDVHFWKHSKVGDTMVVRDECGSGHESAGEVIEIGEGVTGFEIGDRVAIEAGIPCSKPTCEMCRTGRYNACPQVIFFSTPPYHGLLTRYHAHPACWLHKLPPTMSYEEGSLLEPLAVALAGVEKAGVALGDPVLICGAGPIGLTTLLACRAAGATPLAITDLSENRLEFARSLVPSVQTILVSPTSTTKQTAADIRSQMQIEPKIALECTGFEGSINTAIYSVRFGGKVFVIGAGKDELTFPFMHMSAHEIDLQFQFRYANQYPKAIRLVSSGLIDVKPLVSHRFKLEQAVEAFQTCCNPKAKSIKVQIVDY